MEKQKEEIIQILLKSNIKTRNDLAILKRKVAKKYGRLLPNSEILGYLRSFIKQYHKPIKHSMYEVAPHTLARLEGLLRKRPVRSSSGVVNVSVLTKPWPCPGKCIFCPNEKNLPKSYLAKEPAVQRAVANKFNPYKQTTARLAALWAIGHPIDKIEIRIVGGTWSAYPKKYREWFVVECLRACNEFNIEPNQRKSRAKTNLIQSQKKNETTKCRIVGLSVETRPDFINLDEVNFMRTLGITKVELGVQTIYDNILKLNKRGHNVASTIEATRLLKNFGFKISYQIMPNLYGSSFKRDVTIFRELFTNPDFKPDLIKIYPLALIKTTPLYKYYKQGKFKPYSKQRLLKLLTEAKRHIPYWCRVERIIRDIPYEYIVEGGAKQSNLRQALALVLKKKGQKCHCIRCREVKTSFDPKEKVFFFKEEYQSSGGKEIFLSYENKDRSKLFALLRLRIQANQKLCFIRELHTFGPAAEIGKTSKSAQHRGFGKKLLKEAEKIANGFNAKKTCAERSRSIAVISAVGARPYYRKLGYKLQNTYMVKNLKVL